VLGRQRRVPPLQGPEVLPCPPHRHSDVHQRAPCNAAQTAGCVATSQSRIADHGPATVIDLPFLPGGGDNHGTSFWGLRSAELAHEALDRLVAAAKAGLGNQILPDSPGVTALPSSMAS
jgi:hypothetical protein